jgi:hypothetical protein
VPHQDNHQHLLSGFALAIPRRDGNYITRKCLFVANASYKQRHVIDCSCGNLDDLDELSSLLAPSDQGLQAPLEIYLSEPSYFLHLCQLTLPKTKVSSCHLPRASNWTAMWTRRLWWIFAAEDGHDPMCSKSRTRYVILFSMVFLSCGYPKYKNADFLSTIES